MANSSAPRIAFFLSLLATPGLFCAPAAQAPPAPPVDNTDYAAEITKQYEGNVSFLEEPLTEFKKFDAQYLDLEARLSEDAKGTVKYANAVERREKVMAALEDYKSELARFKESYEQRQGGGATKAEFDEFMNRISALRNAGIKVNTDYASLISAMPAPS